MIRLNEFIKFDADAFFKGKTFIFKEGKYVNTDKFTGCTLTLVIDKDDTQYSSPDFKSCNELDELKVKVEGKDETYLKQFKKRMPVVLENAKGTPYIQTSGTFSSMAVSFSGMVKPKQQ